MMNIIYDPTDPRVEIGREYEFSRSYSFNQGKRYGNVFVQKLIQVRPNTQFPFVPEFGLMCTFIREILPIRLLVGGVANDVI
jgi:hypothetical protein